nr:transporter substrate-binding domain-containing protein [uncultured Desulfuromonas sp.]
MILTSEERAYLEKKQTIIFHNENDWKPYDYFENGVSKGFCIDVVRLIAKKVGFKAKFISGQSWNTYMHMLENREVDVLHNTAITPDRERFMIFTQSYVRFRDALFIRKERVGIKSLDDLKGKKLAVVRGYYQEVLLRTYYPEINLFLVDNTTECITAVAEKKVDAAINEVGVSNSFINDYGIQDVNLVSFIQDERFNLDLHFAVHKDNRILRDILQKGLDAISEEEMAKLKKKWLILGPKEEIDYAIFGYIALGGIVLFGLFAYRTWLLKEHNTQLQKAQTSLQEEVQQKEVLLRELNHRVKNNLQIIQGIISLQTSKKDNSNILEEIEGNIQAIALAYDKLVYQDSQDSIQLQSYLRALVEHLPRFGNKKIRVDLVVPEVKIGLHKAVTLGLVITECYNNSVKYAFVPSHADPMFSIQCVVNGSNGLRFIIADNGIGFGPTVINGIGRELMTSLCKNDFQTTPDFYNNQGAVIEILIPHL